MSPNINLFIKFTEIFIEAAEMNSLEKTQSDCPKVLSTRSLRFYDQTHFYGEF